MPGCFGVIEIGPQRSAQLSQELTTIAQGMMSAMRYERFYSGTIVSLPDLGACVGRIGLSVSPEPHGAIDAEQVVAFTVGDVLSSATANEPGWAQIDSGSTAASAASFWSEDGLASIPGNRAGFVADRKRGRCALFTDRYGRERIFLHRTGNRVLFASEAKAILAVAPHTRTFDPAGLAELLACGCTLGSRSPFRDIEILAGGTVMTFERERVTQRRYFDLHSFEQADPASDSEFIEGFRQSLAAAVNRFITSAPRVGMSITGGLDSRMIVASMEAPPGTVPCYTFGSMYRTTGDVAVGRRVAASCGQPHTVVELDKGFLRDIPDVMRHSVYISDGYLGLSGAAELYVNRIVRSIAPARMTGNWGGELMRGVRAFKYSAPKGGFLTPELARQLRDGASSFSTSTWHPVSSTLFHQMPLQGYGRYAVERSQMVMGSPFLADDVIGWLYRASHTARDSKAGAAAIIGQRPQLLTIPTDLGLLGSRPRLLRRMIRRCLIKAEYLTSHGAPDGLTKLSAHLPEWLIERRFLGVDKFQHFSFWTRRDLAGFVRDTLASEANSELGRWFDMKRVRQMVNDHIAGRANYVQELDKIMTVAIVEKTLFAPPTSA